MYVGTGVFITRDSFIVGQPAIATCISDIETTQARGTLMEWLYNEQIINRATSTKQLDLVFRSVNDSVHGRVYTCRVTGEDGEHAEKNFTVKVDGTITSTSWDFLGITYYVQSGWGEEIATLFLQ